MEWTRERVGPEALVTVHNTMTPMLAVENFADYVVCMEWGYGHCSTQCPGPKSYPSSGTLRVRARGPTLNTERLIRSAPAYPPAFLPDHPDDRNSPLARQ